MQMPMRQKNHFPMLVAAAMAALSLAGCSARSVPPVYSPQAGIHQGDRKVYFAMKDPKGDDRGPGTYLYPLKFDNREGFFDITNFQVEDGGANVIFRITTRRPIQKFRRDGSSEAKGWFLQLMDIYIDKDRKKGSGVTRTLPGRWVNFTEEAGWEQMILVTPNRSLDVRRLIEGRTNDLGLVHLKPKIYIPRVVFVEGYDFIVKVPKANIGQPQPHWGYQVMMLPFDSQNLANGQFQNGRVQKFPTTENFGGGSDYLGNPNVIDLLASSEEAQRDWLRDYDARPNAGDSRLATVPFIYSASAPAIASRHSGPNRSRRAAGPPPMQPIARAPGEVPIRQAPAAMPAMTQLPFPGQFQPVARENRFPAPPAQTAQAYGSAPAARVHESPPPGRHAPMPIQGEAARYGLPRQHPDPAIQGQPLAGQAGYQPEPAASPSILQPTRRYRMESFSGSPEDLFLNVPRNR